MKIKKIASYAIGPVGAALISFVTLPLITWFFKQEDIGKYNIYQVVISLSIMITSLGMHQAYVREYHEIDDKGKLIKPSLYPGLILIFSFITLSLFLPVSYSYFIFGVKSKYLDVLIFCGIIFSFFINILVHVLRMQERGLAFSISKLMPKLSFLLFLCFLCFFKEVDSFKILIEVSTLTLFISLIILCCILKEEIIFGIKSELNRHILNKMIRFGFPLVIGGLAYWGLTAVDRLILKNLTNYNEVAIYSVTTSIASGLTVVTSIFTTIWHPQVYKWIHEGLKKDKIQNIVDLMSVFVIFTWTLIGIFSWLVNLFLPNEYMQVGGLLVGCAAMPLIYLLSEVTVVGIGISRRSLYSVMSTLFAFIVNVLLNFLLIPKFLASGAVISSVISFYILLMLRTEFSCLLWIHISRWKLYISILIPVVITIYTIIYKTEYNFQVLMWLAQCTFSVLIYRKKISLIIDFLIKKQWVKHE